MATLREIIHNIDRYGLTYYGSMIPEWFQNITYIAFWTLAVWAIYCLTHGQYIIPKGSESNEGDRREVVLRKVS